MTDQQTIDAINVNYDKLMAGIDMDKATEAGDKLPVLVGTVMDALSITLKHGGDIETAVTLAKSTILHMIDNETELPLNSNTRTRVS